MDNKKPTLNEVARLAGVSLGSASRAMRDSGASDELRKKVMQAAHELGYVPDTRAKALREGRTRTVAFAVPDIGNPVYVEMLKAITAVLSPHGYRVAVVELDGEVQRAVQTVRSFSDGSVDAVIMSTVKVSAEITDALNAAVVPMVIIGQPVAGGDFLTVASDSSRAMELAVEHVVGCGASDLVFVNGPLDTRPGASRQIGFDRAVEALGAAVASARTVRVDDFTLDYGVEAGSRIVRLWDGLSSQPRRAVVAANDLLAIGVVRELLRSGLRVPEDVLVTGVDATRLARMVVPSLTSVSLRAGDRGRLAAQLLLDKLEGAKELPKSVLLEPELVTAESTAVQTEIGGN